MRFLLFLSRFSQVLLQISRTVQFFLNFLFFGFAVHSGWLEIHNQQQQNIKFLFSYNFPITDLIFLFTVLFIHLLIFSIYGKSLFAISTIFFSRKKISQLFQTKKSKNHFSSILMCFHKVYFLFISEFATFWGGQRLFTVFLQFHRQLFKFLACVRFVQVTKLNWIDGLKICFQFCFGFAFHALALSERRIRVELAAESFLSWGSREIDFIEWVELKRGLVG